MTQAPVTRVTLLEQLRAAAPDAGVLIDEHLAEYDGLQLHLLMADLLRLASAEFQRGDRAVASAVVRVVGHALVDGDEEVVNAVAVSFVEDAGVWPDESDEFIASWPASLLAERQRQRDWSPPLA